MRKPKFGKMKNFASRLIYRLGGVVVLLVVLLALDFIVFSDKIYPNIIISGIDVGLLTKNESMSLLAGKIKTPEKTIVGSDSKDYELTLSDVELKFDFDASAERAYKFTRTGNFFYDFGNKISLLFSKASFGLILKYDPGKLDKFISVVSGQESIEGVAPSIAIDKQGIAVDRGEPGIEVDQVLLKSLILDNLSSLKAQKIKIPLLKVDRTISEDEAEALAARAEKFLGKTLELNFEYETFTYKQDDLVNFISPYGGYSDETISKVLEKVASQTERDPQNPKFSFENGRVTEFEPAKDGVKLDSQKLRGKMLESLDLLANSQEKTISIEIPVTKTKPDVSTGEVNNLGINELIGRGYSTYYHSIPSRVHNVTLASSRINGVLIKPGDEFSFNKSLGDVSQFTGYQQAYIIQDGKTVLGDGGGVCQVSSTLFRAILNAGLPITQRQAHAYRVAYYEQGSAPGLDATVYDPSPDLKFKNDTGRHILIVARAEPKKYALTFEIYGTSDGRVASITKPVVSNVTPPPEDLYQDDPTLPVGKIKQIDYKAWGAKVVFNYSVRRDGEEIYKKTFISNYRPWRAVYLRGTGPVD